MRARHLVFVGLLACVRAKGTPATPIDIGSAVAAPSIDVPPPNGACRIKDSNATLDLKVRAGEEVLDLRIIDTETVSEIDREGNAVVHVLGAVEFDGRIVLAKDPDATERSLHTNRSKGRLKLLGGLAKLEDVEILDAHRVDDTASGLVLVGGYAVEDLPIPCDKLRIDERAVSWPMQVSTNDGTWVKARGDTLSVCSTPSGGSPCIRTRAMIFEEVARSGPGVEVRARFDDGSEIHGWAQADQLMTANEPALHGYGASGGCGCGRRMLSHLRIGKPDPREHYGKATLVAGATIYATAELKGPWAKATKDVAIDVEMRGSDDYARVRDLPGVSTTTGCTCPGMDDHAFVKRESIVPIR
jgi:hypothetical protein